MAIKCARTLIDIKSGATPRSRDKEGSDDVTPDFQLGPNQARLHKHKDAQTVLRTANPVAERGHEGRTDLDDWTLSTHRSIHANTDGRGDSLHGGDGSADTTPVLCRCHHDLGDALATSFLSGSLNQRPGDQTSLDWNR
jgi:hypothetical protein